MVSRQKKTCVSNLEFEKMFPKEFIYFNDKSPLEIIKFFLFFIISFDTKNIVKRFKQMGGGDGGDDESDDINEDEEQVADDSVMAMLKEIYNTAKNVAMYIVSKFTAIFVTLIMWSAYPSIPFFAAMAGMAGVLKYIFWKFRKL